MGALVMTVSWTGMAGGVRAGSAQRSDGGSVVPGLRQQRLARRLVTAISAGDEKTIERIGALC